MSNPAAGLRVLFVSAVPTDPPDAGNRVRIMTLTQELKAAGHEVHFAYIPMEACDLSAMQARFGADQLHMLNAQLETNQNFIAYHVRKLGRLLNIERAFYWRLDDWYDERISAQLSALHARHRYDVVFVEYVFASKALDAFPASCKKVLDTHDCFGLRHRVYLEAGMRPQWFSTTLAEEERGFSRADLVLAIQAVEARQFTERLTGSDTRVLQVGHLIDIGPAAPASTREAAIFMGSGNPINVVGARYFIDRVLPIVRRARPGFELLLAGAVSTEIEASEGVVKLGFVPKLQDAFGAAMLSVNPVRAGTGVNIKLLDAMAAAMPIVTTRSGARGLEDLDGHALALVEDDDAEGFAAQVLMLLDDNAARRQLATGARAAAEQWNAEQVSMLATAVNKPLPLAIPENATVASRQTPAILE